MSLIRAKCCCCPACAHCGHGDDVAPCLGEGLHGTGLGGLLPPPCWWRAAIADLAPCPGYSFDTDHGDFWLPRIAAVEAGCWWGLTVPNAGYGWAGPWSEFIVYVRALRYEDSCPDLTPIFYWTMEAGVAFADPGLGTIHTLFHSTWPTFAEEDYVEHSCTEFGGANQIGPCVPAAYPPSATGTILCTPSFQKVHP